MHLHARRQRVVAGSAPPADVHRDRNTPKRMFVERIDCSALGQAHGRRVGASPSHRLLGCRQYGRATNGHTAVAGLRVRRFHGAAGRSRRRCSTSRSARSIRRSARRRRRCARSAAPATRRRPARWPQRLFADRDREQQLVGPHYPGQRTILQNGTSSTLTFTESCGQFSASDLGTDVSLSVELTVTDAVGNTATVNAGSGNQPPLQLKAFTCGL